MWCILWTSLPTLLLSLLNASGLCLVPCPLGPFGYESRNILQVGLRSSWLMNAFKLRQLAPDDDAPMYGAHLRADRIIDYLDATRHLRVQRKLQASTKAWKRVLVKESCPTEFLHDDNTNYEQQRTGRTRIDAAAMLLFRKFWRSLNLYATSVFIFVDASPQDRGMELYAASFDLMHVTPNGNRYERRLFPAINIGRLLFGVLGKTMTLVYQIFLQVGPRYEDIRNVCDSVGGITTDMGMEMRIPDHHDILIPWCKFMKIHVPTTAQPQQHLFPRALLSVGWMSTIPTATQGAIFSQPGCHFQPTHLIYPVYIIILYDSLYVLLAGSIHSVTYFCYSMLFVVTFGVVYFVIQGILRCNV
jgi:hypothetical protein